MNVLTTTLDEIWNAYPELDTKHVREQGVSTDYAAIAQKVLKAIQVGGYLELKENLERLQQIRFKFKMLEGGDVSALRKVIKNAEAFFTKASDFKNVVQRAEVEEISNAFHAYDQLKPYLADRCYWEELAEKYEGQNGHERIVDWLHGACIINRQEDARSIFQIAKENDLMGNLEEMFREPIAIWKNGWLPSFRIQEEVLVNRDFCKIFAPGLASKLEGIQGDRKILMADSVTTCRKVVDFLRTGKIDLESSRLLEAHKLAKEYQIEDLTRILEAMIPEVALHERENQSVRATTIEGIRASIEVAGKVVECVLPYVVAANEGTKLGLLGSITAPVKTAVYTGLCKGALAYINVTLTGAILVYYAGKQGVRWYRGPKPQESA